MPWASVSLTAFLFVLASSLPSSFPKLHFHADGNFKIVQFTDLHLGESYDVDISTLKAMDTILKAELDVDLVVLSGDMVSGFSRRMADPGMWELTYRPVLDKLDAAGVPHAIVLGNHDREGALTGRQIVDVDRRSPLSLTQAGPPSITGDGNYWLDIHIYNSDVPGARLWMLDSMDRDCEGTNGWGCVAYDTVAWMERQAAALPRVSVAAAFVHIPVPEFVNAWLYGTAHGHKGEDTCCPSCNTGLVDAFKRIGVEAIYSGHDHDNDFLANWNGMRFAYGRKSGYGSYGPPEGHFHGARVIVLQENETAAQSYTYLRLENGKRHTQEPAIRGWPRQQASCSSNFFRRRWSRPRACPRRTRDIFWPAWQSER